MISNLTALSPSRTSTSDEILYSQNFITGIEQASHLQQFLSCIMSTSSCRILTLCIADDVQTVDCEALLQKS
jgi:hypothetical protein